MAISAFICNFAHMNAMEKIIGKLGITLNEMQKTAYETIAEGQGDVVVLSPTGSGKTLAYLLPLAECLDAGSDDVQALVIVPGRELALQSDVVLKRMGSGLRSMSCYGGRPTMDEHRQLRQVRPQIVFGTPGRLNDHLQKGNISPYQVRWLIIDEFDKCLEMGFQNEMERLLRSLPGLQRRVLLSATDAEAIPSFVRMQHAQRLDFLADGQPTDERITMYEVRSPQKDKLDTLRQLLLTLGDASSIVFLNYRDSVERVNHYLSEQGFVTSYFHGGLDQKAREAALYRFSNGSANVLVSTDLASRGLDIPDVAHIIHYHLPESPEGYVHRVGRTARWNATGNTYFILGPDESSSVLPDQMAGTATLCNPFPLDGQVDVPVPLPRMATIYIGKGKKDKISRGDIVGFLCKQGHLTSDEIGRIDVHERYSYVAVKRERVRELLRHVAGEKIKGIRTVIEEVH